ncbi:MAG: PASTA domain-containing protein [Oscillospiraceae bacterium]|nr:PASTA domain-containing protein [Oscillospiraceae bacterium]
MGQSDNKKTNRRKGRINKQFNCRTLVFAVCGILAFLLMGYQLVKLQIFQHEDLEKKAVAQQTFYSEDKADRGSIRDRNGNTLAISAPTENVFVSPYEQKNHTDKNGEAAPEDADMISRRLADILDLKYEDVRKRFDNEDSWYEVLKKQVDEETADLIRAFVKEYELTSVHLESTEKRTYPYGSLMCHIIGFVGSENRGLEGVEAGYNSYLTGVNGKEVYLGTSVGKEVISSQFQKYAEGWDGYNITLTTDITIQQIVEKNVEQAIEINDALNGAACIAMNPKTGEVLAMASYGNYDLNDFLTLSDSVQEKIDLIEDEEEKETATTSALLRQWRNKALSDSYEPGSVFKTVTLAMALEEGVVSEEDSFYCGGYSYVTGRTTPIYCSNHAGHGTQSLAVSTQNSCNCAFIEIGARVGAQKFYDYINAFGLFDSTNIDLAGEGNSIWWTNEVFMNPDNKSQLAAASFGQTFAVTPIQMITAISACCNGGYLMQPYVVSSVTDGNGNTIMLNEPTVKRQVISNETSDTINKILETVVTDGGGSNAYVAGYHIAGKTGTSEKVTENLTAQYREYVVSFCGYAPAEDPEVVVLFLLDTPSHSTGRYISGANMAAPVVGSILSETLDYLGYEPDYSAEELAAADTYVPKLYGWSQSDAVSALKYEGLSYEFIGTGKTVTSQIPAGGSVVASGSKVVLFMEAEPETEEVTVPNVIGMSYVEAVRRMEQAGLYVAKESGMAGEGMIVGIQYTESGTVVPYGSIVKLALVSSQQQDD